MKLIRKTRKVKNKNGRWIYYGLFLCLFDNQKIEKRLDKGFKQKSCGCQTGEEISESKKGKKHTEEHNNKISKTRIEKGIAKGENNPMYGKKHTDEAKKLIRKANQDKRMSEEFKSIRSEKYKGIGNPNYGNGDKISGENHWNWQDGISDNPYPQEFKKELKQQILERDDHTCQCPNCTIENPKRMHVHHIDYDKKNNNPKNLITLCGSCHIKTNYNRKYFTEFYQNIMINKLMGCLL